MKRCAQFHRMHSHAGFSIIEMSIVFLVIFVLAGFALINITGIRPRITANSAMSETLGQLRKGRALAIAQRRAVQIDFLGNNRIQLVRLDVPAGTTILSSITLSGNVEFRLFGWMLDTPDQFGNQSPVDFAGATTALFLSDGTLIDPAGNPLNGTVFLGLRDRPETARAVTILGATGRVRDYRWTGTSWIH